MALTAVVFACATATPACGEAGGQPDRPSVAAVPGRDTDRDGLSDRAEVRRYHTSPRKRDTDRDALSDGDEIRRYRTSPRERDTDRDGFGDGVEVRDGTNPRSPRSRPGFPGPDTTGVPPGTTLTPYTGPEEISTPNTVIDGKTMGCVRVTAPGVVIRNSKISCTDFYAVLNADRTYIGKPLLLEDSEVDCKDTRRTGIGDANIVARRLNIHGCENGFDIDQNITVEDSYIHDLYNDPEAHTDGIQLSFGHWNGSAFECCALNVTIRHNTIYSVAVDGSLGTSAIISNSGGDRNIVIENNLLAGGAYALYCEQHSTGVDYVVRNNRFSTKFSPKVGAYGASTECSDETQSGNVHHETGRPLRLP